MFLLYHPWLKRITWRLWLIATLTAAALFTLMQTQTLPRILGEAGGLAVPDTRFEGYSPESLHAFVSAMSQDAFHMYRYVQIPADMFFIAAYLLAGITTLLLVARGVVRTTGKPLHPLVNGAFALATLGLFVSGVCDFFENLLIFRILGHPADPMIRSSWLACAMTVTKSAGISLFLCITPFPALAWAFLWLLRGGKPPDPEKH